MIAAMPAEAAVWWLRTALGDLAAARALVDVPGVVPREVAYLARQATEKALKATIALQGIEPPSTHDLLFLLGRSPGQAGLRHVHVDIAAARCQLPRTLPAIQTPRTLHTTAKRSTDCSEMPHVS